MDAEACEIGCAVVIQWPDHPLFHGDTGVVVERPGMDEAVIRLDVMKPEYSQCDDASTGLVTVDPENLDLTSGARPLHVRHLR